MKLSTVLGLLLGAFTVSIALMFLLAWPVMLLWNGVLVPAVSGVSEISFLQTVGLMLLFRLMFDTKVEYNKSN